ncbi:MAG: hypothetical protein ACLQGP_02685 [Isosphaeraceae bacterium]
MDAIKVDNSSEALACVAESGFEPTSPRGPGPGSGSDSAPEEPSILEDAPESPDEELGLSGSPMRTLSAAEALEKLRRGETIQNVRIDRLVLKGEFPRPVRLIHVVLVRPTLERARFLDEVELGSCTIERLRTAGRSTFAKGWDLRGSTLVHPLIRSVTVAGPWRCDNIKAKGRMLVFDSSFEGPVRFWEARLGGWVEFRGVHFAEAADFRSLHAEEGFLLGKCRFDKDFLFRGSTVNKKWEADSTRFDGLLDLSKAKLHDFVYLESIHQGPEQRFAFHNTVAERLLLRTDQLEGRLASERAGHYAEAMAEYGLLKRVFEGLHRYDQEDWAFYRFKVNQRRCRAHSWRRPWSELARFFDWLLLDRGCGYGTSPLRAVVAALVMILVFAMVYMIGVNSMHVDHAPFDGPADSIPNRIMIGLTTSVAAFTSGFGDLRDVARGGLMNVFLIVESLLGTLLWGLFIVAFSRKVIR